MYSHRVRELVHGRRITGDCTPLLQGIQYTQQELGSSPQIFPNLHTVTWETSEQARTELCGLITFMHDGVRKCTIWCDTSEDPEAVTVLMEAIQSRAPFLAFLDFDFVLEPDLVEPLAIFLANLPRLTYVKIPSFEDVSRIISSLSKSCPNLRTLKIWGNSEERDDIQLESVARIASNRGIEARQKDTFSSLENLTVTVSEYSTICPLLRQHDLRSLNSINLCISPVGEVTGVRTLFQTISQECPGITYLTLRWDSYPDDRDDILVFEDIHEILACKKVLDFTFYAPYAFDLTDADAEQIALAWPQIQKIVLCPYPIGRTRPVDKLSLYAVFLLTHLCPDLQNVGLCINTRPINTPQFTIDSLPTRRGAEVADLKSLVVGNFNLHHNDEFDTAELIGKICGPTCLLEFGIDFDEEDEEYEKMEDRWQTVQLLFPRFSRIYSSIRNLEKELWSLRI
ncbi:hypothetical protein VKT23_018770 [Stygiomarasmius scandens]|uniref:Uncharacterized protein n=1 Tax=Marasmiellus scandens TaxID=2682957 RepID=A0ABR1IN83_9AGAR